MRQNLYARKKRQFLHLSDQVDCLRQDGQWEALDTSVRQRLTRKLKALYREIFGYFSRNEWKRTVAAVGFLLLGSSAIQAQQFQTPVVNPFGLAMPSGDDWIMPTLTDIDSDGDLDVFGSDYYGNPIFYQNNGSASAPSFATPVQNPFGLSGIYTLWRATADLDNDGDIDVMGAVQNYSTYQTQFNYRENTGTASNPVYSGTQADPFGLANVAKPGFLGMEFVDIDNDGDFDMLGVDAYTGGFYFIENTGSASSPNFANGTANPFGLTGTGQLGLTTIGDLDLDGDLDILAGQYYGGFVFYENTGTASAPAFGAPQANPFGLTNIGNYSFSALGDLDDDGDLDLLVSAYSYGSSVGAFYYIENADPSIGLDEQELDVDAFPNPFADRLTVELGEALSGSAVVFDLTGKQVFWTSFNDQDRLRLDLGVLTSGLYLLQIDSEMGSKTMKITKQ